MAQTFGMQYLNTQVEAQASPGVTDAADLLVDKDEHFPFIMFGPGNVSQAHQVDEHVDKSTYLSFVKLFSEMFPTYLQNLK